MSDDDDGRDGVPLCGSCVSMGVGCAMTDADACVRRELRIALQRALALGHRERAESLQVRLIERIRRALTARDQA